MGILRRNCVSRERSSWSRRRDATQRGRVPRKLLDGDDRRNARDRLAQRLFNAHSEGCRLCGAVGASALHGDANRAVRFDVNQFYVAAVGNEAWTQTVEDQFDVFSCNGSAP